MQGRDIMQEQNENAKQNQEKKGNPKRNNLISWIIVIGAAVLVAFIIGNFILLDAKQRSTAMAGTIEKNDRVIAARLAYTFSEPERGDVVVVRYPVDEALNEKTDYIKRIIGMPGETITIKDSKIYINGSSTPLDEPYLTESWTVNNTDYTFTVPEGCYMILGDNRNESSDSRDWAGQAIAAGVTDDLEKAEQYCYVSKKQIKGKVFFRYWPLNKLSSVK